MNRNIILIRFFPEGDRVARQFFAFNLPLCALIHIRFPGPVLQYTFAASTQEQT